MVPDKPSIKSFETRNEYGLGVKLNQQQAVLIARVSKPPLFLVFVVMMPARRSKAANVTLLLTPLVTCWRWWFTPLIFKIVMVPNSSLENCHNKPKPPLKNCGLMVVTKANSLIGLRTIWILLLKSSPETQA